MTTVSVLVIAGTARPYLVDALRSLIDQDFSDWQAIIVDACASETDRSIIASQIANVPDARITVVRPECVEAGFPPYASRQWNFAARYAEGICLAFLDDDDMKEPKWLRLMSEPFLSDPVLGTTLSGGYNIDADGNRQGRLFGEPSFDPAILLAPNFTTTGQLCVRRSLFDEIGGFDETLGCAEDWEFCIRLSKYPWRYVPEISCLKRDTQTNACYHPNVGGWTQDALRRTIRKHALAPDECYDCKLALNEDRDTFVWAVPGLGFRLWHYGCAVERQKQAGGDGVYKS